MEPTKWVQVEMNCTNQWMFHGVSGDFCRLAHNPQNPAACVSTVAVHRLNTASFKHRFSWKAESIRKPVKPCHKRREH